MSEADQLDWGAVVVTGAGSGIGRAVALAFSARGARVTGIDVSQPGLDETRGLAGGGFTPRNADVCDAPAIRAILQDLRLSCLVHCAGIDPAVDLLAQDDAAWQRVFAVNFEGTRNVLLGAARRMRDLGGGRLLACSSVQSTLHEPLHAAYGVAKAAIERLVRAIAVEFAPCGVLVNAIAPGFVDTPMARRDGVHELLHEPLRGRYLASGRLPLGRPAHPEEIAALALLLLDPSNTYLTGQTIAVDGGLSLTL